MKTIEVKYLPPTERRPSRVKATCGSNSVTIGYHDSDRDVYDDAALQLAKAIGWEGTLVHGETGNGVHVYTMIATHNRLHIE